MQSETEPTGQRGVICAGTSYHNNYHLTTLND